MMNQKIQLKNLRDVKDDRLWAEDLYFNSFPKSERKPFEMIEAGNENGKMNAMVCYKDDKPVGIAFVIYGRENNVLDYLAVDPNLRGQNIGTSILEALEDFDDKPLIVEIETTAHGDEEAVRRKKFYLNNGFHDCHQPIELFHVEMELLSTGRPVSFEEYWDTMDRYFDFDASEFVSRKD